MKSDIHPKYELSHVKCACGHTFETRSTIKEISVEICSSCHPFFTGKDKLVDTAGRVDRFKRLVEGKSKAAGSRLGRKVKRARSEVRKKKATEKQ